MDTFTITAYNRTTDTVTMNVTVGGTTYNGVKLQGLPKDTVANVKSYIRGYADAFVAGKAAETAATADISNEVKALLNQATSF